MNSRWFRLLRGGLGLAIIGYAIRFLIKNWDAVRSAPLEWRVRPLLIFGSLLLVLATYALLVEAWRRVVTGWGTPLAFWPAARVWVLSSMGKYLPGKFWAIAGMAVLGKEEGIPVGVATASAIVLQVVSIGTGALVVAASGTRVLEEAKPGTQVVLVVLIGVATVGLALLLWPRALAAIVRRVVGQGEGGGEGEGAIRPPATTPVLIGVVANAVAWVLYGVALFWLAAGLFPAARLSVLEAVGAFTASYLAGFLFLLAPGGLGVREMVFVLVTQSAIGPTHALALAAVSRLGMTVADLLAAAPFVLARRKTGDAT